jgi:hypothetical protein
MRFVHRIGLRASHAQQQELKALGVKLPAGLVLPGGGDPLLTFDVDEEHPNWGKLRALFQLWNVSDFLRTEFSKREIDAARWLEIGAWHHGYPQPDEDVFGYRQVTYDLTDWCEPCGTGKKQKAPFQMKGEPKWGRNGILQLTWIYDELFVTPEVWTSVFKPYGIGRRSVMNTKGGELRTVVQLMIEEEVGIVTGGLPSERCANCGRVKYLPITRGPFPALTGEPSRAMARTREYFGSGGQADKRVLISHELVRSLVAENVRGASLRPVQSGGGSPPG